MYHKVKGPQERTERRISAATSLAMCALTVLLQIGTTLLLASLLHRIRRLFARPSFQAWLHRLTGLIFICFAFRLALEKI